MFGPEPAGAPKLTLTPVSYRQLRGWADDHHGRALSVFVRSCRRVRSEPPARADADGVLARVAGAWPSVCDAARQAQHGIHGDHAARQFFEKSFLAYRVTANDSAEGLFTGYFEPQLRGARRSSARYSTPLYAPPPGGAGLPSRAEIRRGALENRGLELIWLDDPIDAFFLHIQGSGRVQMEDGSTVRVGFAGRNGQPYFAIGRELVARGVLAPGNVSLQTILAWLRANPAEADDVMDMNRSFIFFRLVRGDGPIGAMGLALTPGRSLAIDRRYIPLGAPMWLETVDPLDLKIPLRRLFVAQDTGSAIRGPVRGDVFWGGDADAARRAGRMRSPGSYYLLLPRVASAPIS